VPLVRTSDGKTVVNLEIARFKKQDKNRWASLI